jgi:diaminohydroxyphosphoribosylaminopyrimidine deaminase / 5-amino-6-(5-phosphoribosylamino)uracil reductase
MNRLSPPHAGEAKRQASVSEMHDFANMTLALALGKRGLGQCWPNPAVGAVLAAPETGRVISYGWTSPGGRPHAEAIAITKAGDATRGATLYATLEPCSHWGKTPPCADTAIAAGIKRLVYGAVDPDPRVQGAGLAKFSAHNIEVVETTLSREARWLNIGHALRVTDGRPFVQFKMAVDACGMVPAGDGAPVWVSCEEARAYGHLLRAEADAILIGHGTLTADNPDLTCRLPGLAWRSPVRVVLLSDARMPLNAQMLHSLEKAPVWVICANDAREDDRIRLENVGAACIPVERATAGGGLSPKGVLQALAARGITRVLIEGGPCVGASFFHAGLVDEAVIFQSKKILTGTTLKPQAGLAEIANHEQYILFNNQHLGSDQIIIWRRAAIW